MRALIILAVLAGGGRPRGPTAAPAYSSTEYFVSGSMAGDPVTDHTITLKVTLTAQPGYFLSGTPTFDVGSGCCFDKTRFDSPRLERCPKDPSKTCSATFDVPWRVSGYGNAGGSVSFAVCGIDGCGLRNVGVAVPYQTHP